LLREWINWLKDDNKFIKNFTSPLIDPCQSWIFLVIPHSCRIHGNRLQIHLRSTLTVYSLCELGYLWAIYHSCTSNYGLCAWHNIHRQKSDTHLIPPKTYIFFPLCNFCESTPYNLYYSYFGFSSIGSRILLIDAAAFLVL
jgi:hypothetical protein